MAKSNDDIYDKLERLRLEIKDDMNEVKRDMKGLSNRVGKLEIGQGISNTKLSMLIIGASLAVTAIWEFFVSNVVEALKK